MLATALILTIGLNGATGLSLTTLTTCAAVLTGASDSDWEI